MFKKLLKLNFKVIFRSPIFYLIHAAVILGFLSYIVELPFNPVQDYTNYYITVSGMPYVEIILFIVSFIAAVYFTHKKTTLETCCFISVRYIYTSKLVAAAISFSTLCFIPIIYISISALVEKSTFMLYMLEVGFIILKYLSIILPAVVLGTLIGYIIRPFYSYVFAIPLAAIFSTLFKETIFQCFGHYTEQSYQIYHLLTMNTMYSEGIPVEYRGPELDILFFIKILMSLIVCIIFILVLWQILCGKFRILSVIGILICIGAYAGFSALFIKYHPVSYDDLEKLYILDYEQQPYEIMSYSGNINLKEWSDYSINVGIKKTGVADSVTLRLDESMNIKSLDIDGKNVEYKRKGDILEIFNCPDSDFTLNHSCKGRILYVNDLKSINIYTSNMSCALPPDFAFLPKIDGDKSKKQYDLNVKSKNTLISNLDFKKEDGVYKLSGNSSNACFFSGFLTQTEINGVTFYHASCSKKLQKSFDAYDARINSEKITCFNPETYDFEAYNGEKKSKVFMIYYLYGNNNFFVFYDDYMMYNYGYPF